MPFKFLDDHCTSFKLIFITTILCQLCLSETPDSHFYPSENDEDYRFPKYPFQQYIQVRKTVSVEHVPMYGDREAAEDKPKSDTLQKSASHDVSSSPSGSTEHHQSENYHKPPLREEIFEKKKQEVYEERGYHDGHYDHSSHGDHHRDNGHEGYKQHQPYETSASSANNHYNKHNRRYGGHGGNQREQHVVKKPVGSEDGSSTKVLEYVASNLDKDVHAVGFYKARSHIYCPEVIDFDLSSKSQRMGEGARPKGKRRLSGLGTKIDCLKRKYFGDHPTLLSPAIFMEPAESKKSVIKMGTMDQFWDDIKKTNFH